MRWDSIITSLSAETNISYAQPIRHNCLFSSIMSRVYLDRSPIFPYRADLTTVDMKNQEVPI
jgi:hypothetical protein